VNAVLLEQGSQFMNVSYKGQPQEARVMKIESDHELRWRKLFENQTATFEEATHMLLYRKEDPKQILSAAIGQLKDRRFDDVFAPVCALREVVKAAIARNEYFVEQRDIEQEWGVVLRRSQSGPLPLEALPWAERAVYFLREVLHYVRRDTALLLGLSDGEVDHLTRSAKQRMGYPEASEENLFNRTTGRPDSIRTRHSMAFAAE
jgi:hypothetical protein